jgi:hypothetical protein
MAKKIAKSKTPVSQKNKELPKSKGKRNVIVSYNKIDNALKLELIKKYPEGYGNYIIRYPKPNGEYFFAVPLDTKDTNYLIKVEVKVDNLITEDEFDKQFGDISEVVDNKPIGDVDVEDSNDEEDDDDEDESSGDDKDDGE